MNRNRWLELGRAIARAFPQVKGKMRLLYLVDRQVSHTPSICHVEIQGFTFLIDLKSATQRYMYYFGDFEPEVRKAISAILRPGDTMVDIGANFGFHTLSAARNVTSTGKIIAFEPLPRAFAQLQQNLALNELHQVVAENLALGDSEIDTVIYTFSNQPDTHASMYVSVGDVSEYFNCKITTLDKYTKENCSTECIRLIKLDVEGHELKVLKGANGILQSMRPHVIVEFNPLTLRSAGTSQQELMSYLWSCNYRLEILSAKHEKTVELWHADQLATQRTVNVHAIPLEK